MKIEYHKTFKMMLSLFWKNARFPKKGKMEQKWVGQLEKINFFVYCCKLAHLIFLIFHIHLEGIKGYKLAQTPFLGKFSFCRFWPFLLIFGPKSTFVYCSKLAHYIFLIFCTNSEDNKGYKLPRCHFLEKFSFSKNREKGPKMGKNELFRFLRKIESLIFASK